MPCELGRLGRGRRDRPRAAGRLALLAEARGWIYWRRRTPARSTAGMALQNVQAIFEPQIHHVVERSQIGADQPGDDEPPDPA